MQTEDIRPLVAESHLKKLMEKTVRAKVSQTSSHLLSTGQYQKGFRKGHSTTENLTQIIRKTAKYSRSKRANEGRKLLLVDLAKAYDSIIRDKLHLILLSRAKNPMDEHLVKTIMALNAHQTLIIGSEKIVTTTGVT